MARDSNKHNQTQTNSSTTKVYSPVDFRLSVEGGKPSDVKAVIRTPSGQHHTPMVEDNQEGTVSIKYQPEESGSHEVHVSYQDQPIDEPPLKFHVERVNTGYVTAEGSGLTHGICNEPCQFRIFTKDAGTGELYLSVEGSIKPEVQYNDNEDGTCDVTYWPPAVGDYVITIKFADQDIVGSPFTAHITNPPPTEVVQSNSQILDESRSGDVKKVKVYGPGLEGGYVNQTNQFTIVAREAGYCDLALSIEGPSQPDAECAETEDGSCLVTYKPTQPGIYKISIQFGDEHVIGSPFTVRIIDYEANSISDYRANRINDYQANGISDYQASRINDYQASRISDYRANGISDYQANRTSDYQANYLPQSTINGGYYENDTEYTGNQCELSFNIPNSSILEIMAFVKCPSGRIQPCELLSTGNSNYSIRFTPTEMGRHVLNVTCKNKHIPDSPFEFNVGTAEQIAAVQDFGAHRVRANGKGLIRGEVYSTNEFSIYSDEAGPGELDVSIQGPTKAEVQFSDNKDGSSGVAYVCTEPGEYQVSVKFNDKHIPQSPFRVLIAPRFDDIKKVTIHGLKTKGYEVNRPYTFTVNKNGARGRIDASMTTSSGKEKSCIVQETTEDCYTIRFLPKEKGIHWIYVRFNGRDIPDSPFRIVAEQPYVGTGRVFASGTGLYRGETGQPCEFLIDIRNADTGALSIAVDGPSKVELDCKEVPEGYRVRYTPAISGDYHIGILFSGTHIIGSPFKCVVRSGGTLPRFRRSYGNGLDTLAASLLSYNRRSQGHAMGYSKDDTEEKTRSHSVGSGLDDEPTVDSSRVRAHGLGLRRAFRNDKATFDVDTSEGGNGMLMVGIMGPKYPCKEVFVKYMGKDQYNVQYTPQEKGAHMLTVKWGDEHIPGSPWRVEVT